MEHNLCAEHLEFLTTVDAFLIADNKDSQQWERDQALRIFNRFIRERAEKEVNIHNQTRKMITKLAKQGFDGPESHGIDIRTVFEDAYYEISELVESDSVKNFVRSERFKNWLDSKIQRERAEMYKRDPGRQTRTPSARGLSVHERRLWKATQRQTAAGIR